MTVLLLIVLHVNFNFGQSAQASVGYYPINYGQTLTAQTCVPKATKPPLILRIQGPGTKNQLVEVARVNSWEKLGSSMCESKEYLVKIKWKINRTGSYHLQIFAPNYVIDPFVWPDGVDIPDESKPKNNGGVSSILSRLNKSTSIQWITDPGTLIVATPGNQNVKAVFLTRGCGVWVLPDKASTELFVGEIRGKVAWSFLDKKSKNYIALTTDDDADSASHPCVKAAAKTFSVNLVN